MTSRRGDRGHGTRLAAARAVVVAEMAEVDRVEHVGRAAVAAVLRIGGVRHPCQRERVVLDAEVQHRRVALTAEVGDRGVVGVEHERRLTGRSGVHGRIPAIGDRLQLAVAIELVAEQVAEQDRARVQLGGERVEPQLVHLEQAELAGDAPARAGGGEQRGGDPSGHVRPGLVVHERHAGTLENFGEQRARRGLAVRRRHEHAAPRQARGELADRAGIEAHEDLARCAGRAPAAQARDRADGPREGELGCERARHQSRRLLVRSTGDGGGHGWELAAARRSAGTSHRDSRRRQRARARQIADRVAVGIHREGRSAEI